MEGKKTHQIECFLSSIADGMPGDDRDLLVRRFGFSAASEKILTKITF